MTEVSPISSNSMPKSASEIRKNASSEVNGKIDSPFAQGNIGDCALLSTIFSLSETEQGANAIQDSIHIDKDSEGKITGYDVTFKGIDETYHITQEELEKAKSGIEGNGRKYSYGDDDVTLLELAFEDCFEQSKNETMRSLVDNYTKENIADKLNGVNPASVTYAFTGDTTNWLTVHPEGTINGTFSPNQDTTIQGTDGNDITFKGGSYYKPVSMAKDGSFVNILDYSTNETKSLGYSTLMDDVLNPDRVADKEEAKKLLTGVANGDDNSVVVFATGDSNKASSTGGLTEIPVKGANGEDVILYSPHAYCVSDVKDGIVTLVNPHDTSQTVKATMDSLLALDNFFVYEHNYGERTTTKAEEPKEEPKTVETISNKTEETAQTVTKETSAPVETPELVMTAETKEDKSLFQKIVDFFTGLF